MRRVVFRALTGLGLALLLPALAVAAAPALDLQVELDPASRRFRAQVLVTAPEREFGFELHESLAVTAAAADGKALEVRATAAAGPLRRWRVSLPAGGMPLRLEYGGTLPALDRALDHREVLRALPPMAAPEGSFLPAGSGWYPQPAGLFSYRLTVSVPAGQRALVPGRLLAESEAAGRYRASFDFDRPAEGIDLMTGPWVVRERLVPRPGEAPLRLRTYFTSELDAMPDLAEGYLNDTQAYIERYAREIGTYPFDGFSVVASPLPTGFGMPTLTYLGAEVLKLPFIRSTSLGHEVLHNWWGNGVYVDYATGNWSEGLTTFMADYAYKEDASAEAAREMRLGWLRDFAAVPAGDHQPLAAFRSRVHGAAAAVGYGKAAMVFVMLRDVIGEDAFRRGIRRFWEAQRFRSAGWADLQAAFEEAAGRSLDTFFAQWIRRPGGPAVKIAEARVRGGDRGMHLDLSVEQTGTSYALHLPVELAYAEGSELRWIAVAKARERVSLAVERQPLGVRLDPELRLWRVLEPEQLPPILRQWIVARAPRLVQASSPVEVREAVEALAARLFEQPSRALAPDQPLEGAEPVLVAGLHADVDAILARAGLLPRPAQVDSRGSAQVWTIPPNGHAPVAVVSARDAAALRALLRPLPHYGGQSWLVFEEGRVVERGVWAAPGRLVPVRAGK